MYGIRPLGSFGSKANNDFIAYTKVIKPYETFFNQNIPLDSAAMKKGAAEFEKFAGDWFQIEAHFISNPVQTTQVMLCRKRI